MKIAGVALDDWKLPIFEKILKKEGYNYTVHKGLFAGILILKVETESLEKLASLVTKMNQKAFNSKLH